MNIPIGGIPSNSNQNPLQIKLSKIKSNKPTHQNMKSEKPITKSKKNQSKHTQKQTNEIQTHANKSDE